MRLARCAIPTLLALLAGCADGEATLGSRSIVVRDSAGVTIIEHSAAAVAAVPLMVPGEPELSIGGIDADEEHDATFFSRAWLFDDGLVAFQGRTMRFFRFGLDGTLRGSYGRRGEGPDEFQQPMPFSLDGDSLLVVEVMRSTLRILHPDLGVSATTSYGEGPGFDHQIFGVASDGSLLATYRPTRLGPMEETSGPPRRESRTIERLFPGTTSWDSVMSYRGELVYPMVFTENGHDYPGQRLVTFGPFPSLAVWQGAVVVVDNADRTIAVHGLDGTLRRSIRFAMPLRPVTDAMRDSILARDARDLEDFHGPPAVRARYLADSRAQLFSDSVAPYDRILAVGDGRLWLRLNETPVDTTTTWLGLGAEGRLERRMQLARGWRLLDSRGDRLVIRRTDDDGIGHLEVRPLRPLTPASSD